MAACGFRRSCTRGVRHRLSTGALSHERRQTVHKNPEAILPRYGIVRLVDAMEQSGNPGGRRGLGRNPGDLDPVGTAKGLVAQWPGGALLVLPGQGPKRDRSHHHPGWRRPPIGNQKDRRARKRHRQAFSRIEKARHADWPRRGDLPFGSIIAVDGHGILDSGCDDITRKCAVEARHAVPLVNAAYPTHATPQYIPISPR